MTKNLILGLAAGYHYGDVRPFLASLDRVAFAGDLVLFVSDTTRDLDKITAHGATITPTERTEVLKDIPYNGLRYFLYTEWLATCGQTYDRILLADVRDVIFQREPFSYPWPDGISCTLEDGSATIGNCPHNSHWVQGHLGDDMLARLADRPISCSGTTVADQPAMLDYLEKQTDSLRTYVPAHRMAGYDQAIHNMLIHTGRLDNMTLFDNSGPILTLGQTQGEPAQDAEGYILNDVGEQAHLVHQYDRKPALFNAIRKQFAH
ncbi:hypothetical protein [Pseudodesulfovibrio sediminis]|uniref:Uncharacterized protein n=1 Tax=Pseudodesulfovibrio sediminis TaxID=2810563 RepID=A0ABN6ES29_9BACT|nr:hypothetical protein [Pseudodesulfovibrio sediminis]BCS87951.1 hypothetical protein PSDVSF_11930 [Pseudodesulfovibrio sediminis]